MASITGVHGIGQGLRTTMTRLSREWSGDVARGLRDVGYAGREPQVVVPYLTPLLKARRINLGPEDEDPVAGLADADDAEREFVLSGLDDALAGLSEAEIDELVRSAAVLGVPGVPDWLTRRVQAVDGRWRGAGPLLVRLLREVHAYLFRPEVGAQVRRRVIVNTAEDTPVVIAHSLGSVIAYDLLRRGELDGVTTLVTCGSPLAWTTVRRGLSASWPAGSSNPVGAGGLAGEALADVAWTNVYAASDTVTAGLALGPVWPQVIDHPISNPRGDAHGVTAYLTQERLAEAVATGLDNNAPREPALP